MTEVRAVHPHSEPLSALEKLERDCRSAPDLLSEARRLDAADPLARHLDAFAEAPGVTAYLDGNSLGRPLKDLPEKAAAFIREYWGTRLIRSWD